MSILKEKVLFVGMGKFGTAIAHRLHVNKKCKIFFHTRDDKAAKEFNKNYINPRCFNEYKFEDCCAFTDFSYIKKYGISTIFLSVDSKSIIQTAENMKEHIIKDTKIIVASKGLSMQEPFFYSKILKNILGDRVSVCYFSGPNFADEIIKGDLSISTIAGLSIAKSKQIASLFKGSNISIELTTDIIGVQLFGAMKNIMAITVGMLEGLEYGKNRIIRTLMNFVLETQELSKEHGAQESSAYLAAGIGDIMLTCFDSKSRNKTFGVNIGKARGVKDVDKTYLVEGYYAIKSIRNLVMRHKLKKASVNYINALYDILYNDADPVISLDYAEQLSNSKSLSLKLKIVNFFHVLYLSLKGWMRGTLNKICFWKKLSFFQRRTSQ